MEDQEYSYWESVEHSVCICKCCRIKKSFDTDDSVEIGSVHDCKSEYKEE